MPYLASIVSLDRIAIAISPELKLAPQAVNRHDGSPEKDMREHDYRQPVENQAVAVVAYHSVETPCLVPENHYQGISDAGNTPKTLVQPMLA